MAWRHEWSKTERHTKAGKRSRKCATHANIIAAHPAKSLFFLLYVKINSSGRLTQPYLDFFRTSAERKQCNYKKNKKKESRHIPRQQASAIFGHFDWTACDDLASFPLHCFTGQYKPNTVPLIRAAQMGRPRWKTVSSPRLSMKPLWLPHSRREGGGNGDNIWQTRPLFVPFPFFDITSISF